MISTFAGCGGSSLGYEQAGFEELLAIDWDDNSEETFKLNFKAPFWRRDINEVTGREILAFTGLKEGELDVLDGSPPCQGFSTAGRRKVKDPRNDLFKSYVRLIMELQPRVFVMENVSGQVRGKMKGKFLEIMDELRKTGYKVRTRLLNSANHGVPQARQRLFYIGVRRDLGKEPAFPEPTGHIITVAEALEGVDNEGTEIKVPGKNIAGLARQIRQGENGVTHTVKKNHYSLIRPRADKPCNTVTRMFSDTMTGLLHPYEERFMTIPETKRICGFPDDFKMTGTFEEQWARLGNAVMPPQMKTIAKTIREKIIEK